MPSIKSASDAFLANERVAVTGVSRTPDSHGSNFVYRRLRDRGYQVFAVNPNADEVEGDPSYPDLSSIPGGVHAVVIGTRPERAGATMRECVELGIEHVWMHRSFGAGSVSDAATEYGREHGINIEHACGAVCACSTCHVYVEDGMKAVSEAEEAEEDRVEEAPGLQRNSRLSCQCIIEGDGPITVRVPAWNRNAVKEIPH